jgi:hypothetical protein
MVRERKGGNIEKKLSEQSLGSYWHFWAYSYYDADTSNVTQEKNYPLTGFLGIWWIS